MPSPRQPSTEFLRVITPDEMCAALASFARLGSETVVLDDALHRVLVSPIGSPEDLPERDRSTMDGYAVRAADTFGASASLPLPLKVVGSVRMGELPDVVVGVGQAAQIFTGGFLPEGADAVVMVEQTHRASDTLVEVAKPGTVSENVLMRGEDVRRDQVVWRPGARLQAWDIGLMAGLGITDVEVSRRPRVAVISTGDEVVPIDSRPEPGQIRDANLHAVGALLRSRGCEPLAGAIVPDDAAALRAALENALSAADMVVLSGGSSVGERDIMLETVSALPETTIMAHGVAMRPGKPTLLARAGEKAVLGLPGNPMSALVVAQVFLAPFVGFVQGEPMVKGPLGTRVRATLSTSVHSAQGREEYIRVRLEEKDGERMAAPVFGKSGTLSPMVGSDGLMVLPIHLEGLAKGESTEVVLDGA